MAVHSLCSTMCNVTLWVITRLRLHIEALEDDFEKLSLSDPKSFNNQSNVFVNHIWSYLSLFFGLISILISILWVAQIVVYMILDPPPTQLLNDYLTWFDTWFPLFGTLTVRSVQLNADPCVCVGSTAR